jgi:L-ascorbate metabolism protein UlaG (beta-lactamase superfamily)
MQFRLLFFIAIVFFTSCKNDAETITDQSQEKSDMVETTEAEKVQPTITPIEHASMVIEWDDYVLYIDPVGGKEVYNDLPEPDIILITDIHGDHMDEQTIQEVMVPKKTRILAPRAVKAKSQQLSSINAIDNGQTITPFGFEISAVPMYNTTPSRKQFHEKGRGNGYLISRNGYTVYISGDTENIPEMEEFGEVDKAFLCMNLPYTMNIDQAVEATAMINPKIVVPYHYRGKDGFADIQRFKQLVTENTDTEVRLMEWYPEK